MTNTNENTEPVKEQIKAYMQAQEAHTDYLKKELNRTKDRQKLIDSIPAWSDPQTAKKQGEELVKYLNEISPTLFKLIEDDADLIILAVKAMKFDKAAKHFNAFKK